MGNMTKKPYVENSITEVGLEIPTTWIPARVFTNPFHLLMVTMVSIFLAEGIIMLILSILPPLSLFKNTLLDALSLVVLVFPVLYLIMFKPLLIHITERRRVEEKLVKHRESLEEEVQERISEIIVANEQLQQEITERKHAEEKIQLQFKRLNVLHSIERAVTASLNLRHTLDILLDQITTQLSIDAAGVLLLNKHTQILKYIVNRGFRSSALKYTQLKLGEGNAGRAALERRTVTIPNLKEKSEVFKVSKHFAEEDFVSYFAIPLIANGQVKGVLELFHRVLLDVDQEWVEFIETIADQVSIAIDNASLFEDLQRSNVELTLAYDSTIEGLSRALDYRDKETEGHSQRVTELTVTIARAMGIDEEELVHARRGALLHDIGKLGIPDSILLKPDNLTDNEREIMKKHPYMAYEMLSPISFLRKALDIPYYHHEKWDGTGYPRGLKGEEIPFSARIFSVVDVWDALRSYRPYRPAWPKDKALEYMKSLSGTHFDPKVVEVFLKMALLY